MTTTMFDYRDRPILRPTLAHTGRLDGDDTGYRDVAISPLDAEAPDPMVRLDGIPCYPVYARGARPKITPFYGPGVGAPDPIWVRAPVAAALREANDRLADYDRQLLVLDGFRSASVQARLFMDVFERLGEGEGRSIDALSIGDWIRLGRRADDTASFCRLRAGDSLAGAIDDLRAGPAGDDLRSVAAEMSSDECAVALEYLTYRANHAGDSRFLDPAANTAHGSGGACDLWLLDLRDGEPVSLGVPFDSTAVPAVMDYFEWATAADYARAVSGDAPLRHYLAEFGLDPASITAEVMASIRRERRILFHAMRDVGATYFSLGRDSGEPWHFNFGNERGGRQATLLPGAGNACHSILKDVRDPATGAWTAAWGNATAHRLVEAELAAATVPR